MNIMKIPMKIPLEILRHLGVSKGRAFVMCFYGIMFIFCIGFLAAIIFKEHTLIPFEFCLNGITMLSGIYIGGQVLNNGVKGKCWSNEMWEHENKPDGEEKK